MKKKLLSLILLSILLVFFSSCQPANQSPKTKESPQAGASPAVETSVDEPSPQATLNEEKSVRKAKEFVLLMVEGDYSKAYERFAPIMKGAMSEEKLKTTWGKLIDKVGSFKKIEKSRVEEKGKFKSVIFTTQFEITSIEIKVVLDSEGRVSGLWFSKSFTGEYQLPKYADRDKFREIKVTVGKGEWELPGILTIPEGKGPFPAVVLVHGSGPLDRDETVGPNKPFKDIALGLASRGIAVLRYDKRTFIYPQKIREMKDLTVREETIDDVLKAVKLLRKQNEIDNKRIFVLGHSLGGMLIPRIARRDREKEIAGFIIMAGATLPLDDKVYEQHQYIFNLDNVITPDEKKKLDELEGEIEKIKKLDKNDDKNSGKLYLNAPASYWLDLRNYHPDIMAKNIKKPVFIIQGQRDYQVTQKDFEKWKQALGNKKNVKFKNYPDLNHLMIKGSGKISPREYEKPGNVSSEVIKDVASWIKKN